VTDEAILTNKEEGIDEVRDYVYIDDAVDAIMSAMQYRTANKVPTVVNVGTGKGASLREIAIIMESIAPKKKKTMDLGRPALSKSRAIASVDRSDLLLGFEPQVDLKEGILRLVSWHYDRAYPRGGTTGAQDLKGIASCSPYDKECLRGAPVYPCASECSHQTQCTTSYFDDVLVFTRSITSECETVLYTVAAENDLSVIASANVAASPGQQSHMKGNCNIAFVSEISPLVRNAKIDQKFPLTTTVVEQFLHVTSIADDGKENEDVHLLKHGFWTLVPLLIPSFKTGDEHILHLLPKLSPGLFFGQKTKKAIYSAPNVVFRSIPALLEETKMLPFQTGVSGATGLLIGRERNLRRRRKAAVPSTNEAVQSAAYRMIRIGVIDEMPANPILEPSWMVHTLQHEDSRLFRCDIFNEIIQWDVGQDKSALEFIIGLHDMWSRVIVNGKDIDTYWVGDKVVTVREDRRRLAQVEEASKAEEETDTQEAGDEEENGEEEGEENDEGEDEEGEENDEGEDEEGDRIDEAEVTKIDQKVEDNGKGQTKENVEDATTTGVGKTFEVEIDTGEKSKPAEDKSAFGGGESGAQSEADQVAANAAERAKELDGVEGPDQAEKKKTGDEQGDDEVTPEDGNREAETDVKLDISSYDTWMGILSAAQPQHFVRIVPSDEVGAIFLDELSTSGMA